VLTDLRYGLSDPGAVPLPLPGTSVTRNFGTGTYIVGTTPTPSSRTGSPFLSLACAREEIAAARVSEVQLTCTSGSRAGQCVELVQPRTADEFDTSLALRAFARDGTSLGEQRDLFGALSGQPWAVGRDWLIATSAFATSDGRPADATLQLSLDPGGGRLEL